MAEGLKSPAGMVCLGVIAGAHGVRGEVKVRTFTADPAAVAAYGPLTDASGRRGLRLSVRACRREWVIAAVEGVADRSAAEALSGVELFVPRRALPPPPPEEFYYADLIGLDVDLVAAEGGLISRGFGRVRDVFDAGGGPLLDIVCTDGGSVLVPFTRAAVPQIDPARRRLAVADLPGLVSPDADPPQGTDRRAVVAGDGR
jgi:16S rRNA processing protein RimM